MKLSRNLSDLFCISVCRILFHAQRRHVQCETQCPVERLRRVSAPWRLLSLSHPHTIPNHCLVLCQWRDRGHYRGFAFGPPDNPFVGVSSAPHDPYIEVESEDQVEFTFTFLLLLAAIVASGLELFYFLFQLDLDEEDKDDTCFPFLCRGFRRRRVSAMVYSTVRLPLLVVALYINRWAFLAMLLWLPILLGGAWIIYAPLHGIAKLTRSIQRDLQELGSSYSSV